MNNSELFKTPENIANSNMFIANSLISKIRSIIGDNDYITDEEIYAAIKLAYQNGYYDCKGQTLLDFHIKRNK